jgi:hypothetical protein
VASTSSKSLNLISDIILKRIIPQCGHKPPFALRYAPLYIGDL